MLGDKTYNFNFYGLPTGRTWDTEDDMGTAIAYCTKDNIATYYVHWDYLGGVPYPNGYNADYEGKPFDTSIELWKIPANATYATKSMLNINASNTLDFDVSSEQFNSPVSVAMAAVDTTGSDGPLYRDPYKRYAYDICYDIGLGYCSAFLSDIDYSKFCLFPRAYVYRKTDDNLSPYPLSGLKNYINSDPDNRDVCIIRETMYRGTVLPRKSTSWDIPQDTIAYRLPRKCSPVLDTLTDLPIPDNAAAIKESIQNGHDAYEDSMTYAPFFYDCNYPLYSSGTTSTARMHDIGMFFTRTVNNVRNGSYDVTNTSPVKRTSATISRYNDSRKNFDDVAYHWTFEVRYKEGGYNLSNGDDISALTGSHTLYFMTKLVIDDMKDAATKGEAVYRAVLHEVAYLGLYFTDTEAKAQSTNFASDSLTGVFCPVFDNGVTTGLYATGNDIKQLPNWNSSSVADEVFKNIPGASDSDSGDLTTHTHLGYVTGGAHWYGMTSTELGQLSTWLNTTYQPTDETEFIQDFKGVNPADYIVSIKYYPFAVPTTNLTVSFVIGGLTVSGLSPEVLLRDYGKGSSSWYDLGSITLQQPLVYGDFRDKYIKMLLYVPWCGMATIDPAVFCPSPDGTIHTLSVALSIDFATGSCTGYIYRDYTLIDSIQGSCGIDIPMSAVNNGSYQNQIKQTEIALKQAENTRTAALVGAVGASIATGAAIVTGNPLAVAAAAGGVLSAGTKYENAALQVEGLQYQLEHTAPAVGNVSAASPFNNMIDEQAARIFIFKPVMLQNADVAAYGHTVGYACCKAGKLSSFSGFTVCSDADLSGIKAPSGHKTAIMQLLQGGVYL